MWRPNYSKFHREEGRRDAIIGLMRLFWCIPSPPPSQNQSPLTILAQGRFSIHALSPRHLHFIWSFQPWAPSHHVLITKSLGMFILSSALPIEKSYPFCVLTWRKRHHLHTLQNRAGRNKASNPFWEARVGEGVNTNDCHPPPHLVCLWLEDSEFIGVGWVLWLIRLRVSDKPA